MPLFQILSLLLVLSSPSVLGIEPLLVSPGNTTILVILDVHRGYVDGDTCTSPTWRALELAYSMWGSIVNSGNNEIGIEIYDGCSSTDRALEVIRHRLFSNSAAPPNQPPVSCVVTLLGPDATDAVSGAVKMSDALNVNIGTSLQQSSVRSTGTNVITFDLSPRTTIEVLQSLLEKLNWTFVTTLSDEDPTSAWGQRHFLENKDGGICVPNSVFNTSSSSLQNVTFETDGVVAFISSPDNLNSDGIRNPMVAIASETIVSELTGSAIVISQSFDPVMQLSDLMTGEVLQTAASGLILEYFTSVFNCNFNTTTSTVECPDIEDMKQYFIDITATDLFHAIPDLMGSLTRVVRKAIQSNCTVVNEPQSCWDITEFDDDFKATDMGVMVPKAMLNTSITFSKEGKVISSQVVQSLESIGLDTQLDEFIRSLNDMFPSSRCPDCKNNGCGTEGKLTFSGEYIYTPGDIVIAGMFPMTQHLRADVTGTSCSGYTVTGNTDILAEAFQYAVDTFKERYNGVLQDLTIGSVVFDTCSEDSRASQIMLNFESGNYAFVSSNSSSRLNLVPGHVPAYLTYHTSQQGTSSYSSQKLQMNLNENGKIYNQNSVFFYGSMFNYNAVVDVLHQMDWSLVSLITSQSARVDINMEAFFQRANNQSICITNEFIISNYQDVLDTLYSIRQNTAVGVYIIFADRNTVDTFLKTLVSRPISRTWIVMETRKHWLDITEAISGAIILRRAGRINAGFDSYIEREVDNQLVYQSPDSWLDDFKSARDLCTDCDLPYRITDLETRLRSSDVIRTVDLTIHAIDKAYRSVCSNETAPCRSFFKDGFRLVADELDEVAFEYEGERIDLTAGNQMESYQILNIQSSRLVEIGSWTPGQLDLVKSRYKSYDSAGDEIRSGRQSTCIGRCVCQNAKNSTSTDGGVNDVMTPDKFLDPDMGYQDSSGKFNKDLWSIVVVIIAGSGAFVTLCLMLYIMCKVCSGALVRSYLALGLMLLVAMILLFMSVLPFVFTPSEAVCGMRFFAHGVAFALCFAIILTKMTTLRDYRYIGLGGEISRINQFLSVFFITSVQIAIGIEWWVLRTPVLYTEVNATIRGDDPATVIPTTYYACDFKRGDFIAYHSFILFLMVLCCLYSISVRKETKNMKEARLLLISSWFCLALWITLVITLSLMDRDYLEMICSIGVLANALTFMVVIYFPKLSALSRLKYEVSANRKGKNGYKSDSDFQFERPYSLPGTLHSSVTDKSYSYPRSLAAFDSGLTY